MAATRPASEVLCNYPATHDSPRGRGRTDADLLERFVAHNDEAAFEALVRRHGPLVLAVCRHLLSSPQDVEDAFQTTFLILVRKAGSIGRRDLLSSWLYGVAYRVAVRARAHAARRRAHEKQGAEWVAAEPARQAAWHDLGTVLHEELHRLPEKYRPSVVLCYLEGKTLDEAAEQLGCSRGTIKGRLERARSLLRQRLTRRGLAISTALFALMMSQGVASVAVPARLVAATVPVGMAAAAGKALADLVSAQVLLWTEEVLQALTRARFALGAPLFAALLVVLIAAGLLPRLAAMASPATADRGAITRPARSDGEQSRAGQFEPPECRDGRSRR